jgi:hypothetical protein
MAFVEKKCSVEVDSRHTTLTLTLTHTHAQTQTPLSALCVESRGVADLLSFQIPLSTPATEEL